MASFDQIAREFQRAQREVNNGGSRDAQQRLEAARAALSSSKEAASQRAATERLAAKVGPGRIRSWW